MRTGAPEVALVLAAAHEGPVFARGVLAAERIVPVLARLVLPTDSRQHRAPESCRETP